jgi:pimeloyl-ACP methyl ester carboxylesterase
MRSAWLDVDWDEHRRRTVVDGSEIEYVDLGSGPAMVFIHGLGACWQTWLENLPFFAESHRCVAMDLAGFGASEPVDGDVSIERYARAVAELLDQLGIERAVVAGNSMGGFIALELAVHHPERVDRLVLVSAAVFWQEYRHAQPLVALARATEGTLGRALVGSESWLVRRPRLREIALSFGGIHAPASLPEELQAEILLTAKRTEGFLPALRALVSYPLREELNRVRCPTLVVWGDKDTLVGVRHAFELGRELADAEVSIYEGVGHVVMLEAPERFNREVAAFISV